MSATVFLLKKQNKATLCLAALDPHCSSSTSSQSQLESHFPDRLTPVSVHWKVDS